MGQFSRLQVITNLKILEYISEQLRSVTWYLYIQQTVIQIVLLDERKVPVHI